MSTLSEQLPEATGAPRALPVLSPSAVSILRGAARGGMLATMIGVGLIWVDQGLTYYKVIDFLIGAALGFLCLSLFDGLLSLLRAVLSGVSGRLGWTRLQAWLRAFPVTPVGWLLGMVVLITLDWFLGISVGKYVAVPPLVEIGMVLSAIAGGLLAFARLPGGSAARRAVPVALVITGFAAYAVWGFGPGSDDHLPEIASMSAARAVPLSLENPGLPGSYAVSSLSYGAGTDNRRDEYAEGVTLTTTPVDGSPIFAGYEGLADRFFRWYWGFDFTQLPLNGLVWYPEGDGPFPLVLIVHGNHDMGEPSDPGYAYLGEHLASRGMIAVSVDQNFLNGWILADGNMDEMPLRAWMLLKHLQTWRDWNAEPGNPFYGKVDLERVGLIGHSRGGEAVAHAAELNAYDHAPVKQVDTAEDFGFGIQGVVALAPCDNRWQPDGKELALKNADYLLLATGHDADMYWLDGQAQYNRATLADRPEGFKSVAYLYRGNHGQFNTVWGDDDRGIINSFLLNRAPYLSGDEQRQAARVLITSFLESSLNGADAYRAVFYDPAAAAGWLPEDAIVTQYQDHEFIPVDTNELGGRQHVEVRGAKAAAEDMSEWKAVAHQSRHDGTTLHDRVLQFAWAAGSEPVYEVSLPTEEVARWSLAGDDALVLSLGNALTGTVESPGEIVVELETDRAAVARLPLSDFAPVHPSLPVAFTKAPWIAPMTGYDIEVFRPEEFVLQTYTLPLSAFTQVSPNFDPAHLRAIRVRFDGSKDGAVLLDDIGFWPLPAESALQ
jgi:dienelactone hydrolase